MIWEHLYQYIPEISNNALNELGSKGWELCASRGSTYFFKRPMKCVNCFHYKVSYNVDAYRDTTITNELCMKDINNTKNTTANCSGCEHFKSKIK